MAGLSASRIRANPGHSGSAYFGCKNEGIDELVDHAIHVARHRETPARIDFCAESDMPGDQVGAVHRAIHSTVHLIEPYAKAADLPVRFSATKVIENDPLIAKALALPPEAQTAWNKSYVSWSGQRLDREAALANMRFTFIENVCAKTVVKPHESQEHRRSVALDRILTGKYTAIPAFFWNYGLHLCHDLQLYRSRSVGGHGHGLDA